MQDSGITAEKYFSIILTIAGSATALAGFAFGWIIKLIKTQNSAAIHNLKEDSEMKQVLISHSKDIEFLKKNNDGVQRKLEDLAGEFGILRLSVNENSLITSNLKKEIDLIDKKIDNLNGNIDILKSGMQQILREVEKK